MNCSDPNFDPRCQVSPCYLSHLVNKRQLFGVALIPRSSKVERFSMCFPGRLNSSNFEAKRRAWNDGVLWQH